MEPGRGTFDQTSNFQGERGGDAHDEELLALLRQAGSNRNSKSSDRFGETATTSSSEPTKQLPKEQPTSVTPPRSATVAVPPTTATTMN